jgi:hypothetical protein
MATLLQLVQDAATELSLNSPAVVVSSQDQDVRQLLALANAAGADLVKAWEWQFLLNEYTFVTTTASQYALPSDYDRLVNDTQWDRTSRWPGIGPASSQTWAWLKGQMIASVPRYRFRILGNQFTTYPSPRVGFTYSFEYVGRNWIVAADGITYKSRFTADDDQHRYDDRLMVALLKSKYLAAKGLDSTIVQTEFIERLELCKSHDQAAPKLSLGPQIIDPLLGMQNVPDGSWTLTP